MNAYIYRAALLCPECASKTMLSLLDAKAPYSEDSDKCPQGPYADGGGESDSPQHCDHCGVFLENPLTSDGEEFVIGQAMCDHGAFLTRRGVWNEWRRYYSHLFRDTAETCEC